MTIQANAWCSVYYITQDFTAIFEIGQLHKGVGSKYCLFGLFFTFSWALVYMGLMYGREISVIGG